MTISWIIPSMLYNVVSIVLQGLEADKQVVIFRDFGIDMLAINFLGVQS